MGVLDHENAVREADWKIFRELREVALERFCQRILAEIEELIGEDGTYHDRYGKIYELLRRRDNQIADGFDGPRRSWMDEHLVVINRLGLFTPEEIARFSEGTQKRTRMLNGTDAGKE